MSSDCLQGSYRPMLSLASRRGLFAGLASLAATGLAALGPFLIGETGAQKKAKKVTLGLDGQTVKVSKR